MVPHQPSIHTIFECDGKIYSRISFALIEGLPLGNLKQFPAYDLESLILASTILQCPLFDFLYDI